MKATRTAPSPAQIFTAGVIRACPVMGSSGSAAAGIAGPLVVTAIWVSSSV